jgi:amino acid transporter
LSEFVSLEVIVGALLLLAAVTVVNLRGIAESVRINFGLTVVEVFGLLLIVAIAVVAVADGSGEPGRALEFKQGSSVFAATLAGAVLAFYALIGFEDSANVAEETQRPRYAYPRALFGGLGLAGSIYLLVAIAAVTVVPVANLADSSGPLLEVVEQGPLAIPEKLFSAIGLLALSNGALINMIMASRLLYGMGEERVVPRQFGLLLPRRRTPWVAIAFTATVAAALIATGDLEELADTTVALLVVIFAVVNVTVLYLRRDPVEAEHFRVPSAFPVLGVAVSIALLTQIEAEVLARAGILIAIGAVLWLVNELLLRRGPGVGDLQSGAR